MLVDLTTTTANEAPVLELTAPILEKVRGEKPQLPPVAEGMHSFFGNARLIHSFEADSPRLFPNDTFPRSLKESTGIGALKQSIKQSLGELSRSNASYSFCL